MEKFSTGGEKVDILKFWEQNHSLQPLDEVAQKYLCVPATSVPSERMFSKAGATITNNRSRLSPTKAEKIIFLNANQWLLD